MNGMDSATPSWRQKASDCLPLFVAIAAALFTWLIFAPGNMSFDSFLQYREAFTFDYNNWHPPIMSIVLSIFMFYGGGIGSLVLVQCLSGVLGIRTLSMLVLEQISQGRWSPNRIRWCATLTVLLLLVPITPTAFYLVTFWKDSWEIVFFLWTAVVGMRIFQNCKELSRRAFFLQLAGLLLLMIMAGITRHNALVAMPAMGCMFWMILARRGIRFAWASVAIPMAASLLTTSSIDRLYSVQRYHPIDHVKMLELVGMCIEFPECRDEFPYISSNLLPGGEKLFRIGYIFSLSDPNGPVVKRALLESPNREVLNAEYRKAILRCPLRLLYMKWRAFCLIFDPINMPGCYCQKRLDANPYGLHQYKLFSKFRTAMILALEKSVQSHLLNWLGYHNLWFSLNIAAIIGLAVHFRRRKSPFLIFWSLLLAIPLFYTLSYFAAATGADYRFLYPSTLFMQVLALSVANFYCVQYFSPAKYAAHAVCGNSAEQLGNR